MVPSWWDWWLEYLTVVEWIGAILGIIVGLLGAGGMLFSSSSTPKQRIAAIPGGALLGFMIFGAVVLILGVPVLIFEEIFH